MEMKLHRVMLAGCMTCTRMYMTLGGNFYSKRLFSSGRSSDWSRPALQCSHSTQARRSPSAAGRKENLLQGGATWPASFIRHRVTDAPVSSVPPAFVVMKFDQEGNVTSFEKKKTELCQELSLQARDLRFQHSTSLTARNNCIIIRMEPVCK
ncbi:Magnesium transporter MRS2-like protein, mitochondrial MRS2-like protein Precursor [Larimichthys crocea]|uniref:Magnesium transporter MRS2-like protein, mitochondrial MRS2-like protein n=1 Tax=Larimichthys crocea TaxID=215358 RepID=A0A6G0IAS4_LARCR|nr:Magnesium transporter MRS2-like protein, mitochondrial MRS2-like protein Precursor [Larimichthys crocea]